jgi:hypothetical protein
MLNRMKKPAALVLLSTVTACTSLQPVADTTTFMEQKNPRFVVITTEQSENGDPIVLTRPQLDAGNLTGTSDGEELVVPMRTIRTLRAVQTDKRRTTLAIVGAAVGVGVLGYLMVNVGNRIDDSTVCVPGGHRGSGPYCEGYDGIIRR